MFLHMSGEKKNETDDLYPTILAQEISRDK